MQFGAQTGLVHHALQGKAQQGMANIVPMGPEAFLGGQLYMFTSA